MTNSNNGRNGDLRFINLVVNSWNASVFIKEKRILCKKVCNVRAEILGYKNSLDSASL